MTEGINLQHFKMVQCLSVLPSGFLQCRDLQFTLTGDSKLVLNASMISIYIYILYASVLWLSGNLSRVPCLSFNVSSDLLHPSSTDKRVANGRMACHKTLASRKMHFGYLTWLQIPQAVRRFIVKMLEKYTYFLCSCASVKTPGVWVWFAEAERLQKQIYGNAWGEKNNRIQL